MLQLCKKINKADLLYSKQRSDFSHIVFYINIHHNATWTAKIPEKFHGASQKEDRKLKGNIFFHEIKTAMKQFELIKNKSLPVNFYTRENFPEFANICANSDCDSCWANRSTDCLNKKARIKS